MSAITIYAGEPVNITLEKPFDYYSVVGNSSPVELEVIQNGNVVTVIPNKYSPSDTYEVIFFDREKETITVHHSSGGGSTRYVDKIIDNNITTYVDREVVIPGKDLEVPVEVEKFITKTPWIAWAVIVCLSMVLAGVIIFRKRLFERRY